MQAKRALVIEDNPVDAQFIRQMLLRGGAQPGSQAEFDVSLASNLAGGLGLLQQGAFDVVLLDLTLPDCKGLETFQTLHERAPGVPVVVLTGESDEQIAITAVQSGAQDYLVKGLVNSNVLMRFVRYAMERHRLLEDVRRQAREIAERDRHSRLVIERLQAGFASLAAGDFKARVAGELQELNHDLAGLLAAFDQTVERLDELTAMNSQFRQMAAHDMRAPLTSLLLAMGPLRDAELPAEKRERLLQMMGRSVKKILRLIDSLLDFFDVAAGRIELNCELTEMDVLAHECANDLSPLARERQQRILVEPSGSDSAIWCDRMKISRVLDNLVSNAIKYSNSGDEILVRVSLPGDGLVRVEVLDHGDGIAEAELSQVFERYRRASHSDRSVKGCGLGLSICRDYVQAHGGRIWVESRKGGGARFLVELPRESRLAS